MTPAQKFVLGCRQTREAAARLSDWLEHQPALLGLQQAAVREDITALAARLSAFAAAAETVPGIGLLAAPGAGKMDLLFQLIAARGPLTLAEFGSRPLEPATIRALLPEAGSGSASAGSCVVLRLTSAETPPSPRGFSIRVGLLSPTDIAAILTAASLLSSPANNHTRLADTVDAVFADVTSRLSAQALPGLSERDVLDLRDLLSARWPSSPRLDALAAARYWEQFRDIAAHVNDADRRRLFALLWNNDSAFSELFHRMSDGLDRLGQGSDAYCAPDALLGKDKQSGWITRHPRSIIDTATLLTLEHPPGPMVSMMNRYGQTVDIERAVAAAIISELPLHLGASRLNDLAPAELLDFPLPPALGAEHSLPAALSSRGLPAAVANFARAKALYLFERASARRDVTALVAVLNPALEDAAFAPAVGDWVEAAQGVNAHARERVRRGLFIAARAPDSPAVSPLGRDAAIQDLIHTIFGADQDWPAAWTPNRPLTEVFWFATADAFAPAAAASTALAPVAAATPARVDAVGQLVKSLAAAATPRVKLLQLTQSLQDLRRRLRQTVLRQHVSNDPATIADWRRGTAVVVQDRLQFLVEQGRLAHLHRALLPSEADLKLVLRKAQADATRHQASAPPTWSEVEDPQDGGAAAPLQVAGLAEAAVSHWFSTMRRLVRSSRLCRDLRIEPSVMQNLVDELQIGAQRCGLASEIAHAYTQSTALQLQNARTAGQDAPRRLGTLDADLTRAAAYACRIMSAYIEVLGPVGGRSRPAALRAVRTPSLELEVADAERAGYATQGARPRGGPRRTARPTHSNWEVSFVTLVEDNIAAAQVLAGHGDKDRELGELIQLFASGPFEVEP